MRWTLIAAAAALAAAASVLPQFLIAFLSHRACIFSQSAGNVVGLSVSLVCLTVRPIESSPGLFGQVAALQSVLAVNLSCISSFMDII